MAVSPAVQKHFDNTKAYIDDLNAGIDGMAGDITSLNAIIAQLQSTQGQISQEDQALLDQAETIGKSAAEKLKGVDSLTPPPAPPTV